MSEDGVRRRDGCLPVPAGLAGAAKSFRGGVGAEWLQRLPAIVAECAARWSLVLGAPYLDASLNYVAPAVRLGEERVILKIGLLAEEIRREADALRLYGGCGAARLLECDETCSAMLVERLEPGTNLVGLPDEQAVAIAGQVMQALWRPAPAVHAFDDLRSWVGGLSGLRETFGGGTGPLPDRSVRRAELVAEDLLATMPEPVLLHGDLHHYNVLSAARAPWLVIDPKGVVGDAAFEPAAFVSNQWEDAADPAALLSRRLQQFADAQGLDPGRVCGWALVHAVLSAWWHIEDSGQCPADAVRYIELVDAVTTGRC